MKPTLWKRLGWTACFVLVATGAVWAQGTIDGVSVSPNPGCVNQEVTATIQGTGTCDSLRINFDFLGGGSPQTISNVSFPLPVPHTYTTGGNKQVRVLSNTNCSGVATTNVDIASTCLSAEIFEDMDLFYLPKITGGWGLVQPGNPFPVLILGRGFGGTEGNVFLQGSFGIIELPVLEWGGDGKYVSVMIPDGICGVQDQTASIRVLTANNLSSNFWPVQFTAKREVMPIPRADASVITCSHDSNKDCCNGECDPSDLDWFSTCGGGPTATICGFHLNTWAAIGDDSGTDKYRVDIRPSFWVIEHWLFDVTVDQGEGWAQLQPSNAFQEKVGDFEIKWLVTPNDDVFYNLMVMMSGPCGTSPDLTFSRAILDEMMQMMEMQARSGDRGRRAWGAVMDARKRIGAEERRAALAKDRETQPRLVKARAAVTEESIAEAKALEAIQRDARTIHDRAASPGADREEIVRAIEALRGRLPRPDRSKARRPRE